MNSKIRRCGYCSDFIDADCRPVDEKTYDRLVVLAKKYGSGAIDRHSFKDHGKCCREPEPRYAVVTREMALDAGDPLLEGQIIEW